MAETLLPQDFRQRFHQLTPRQLSRGHAERFDAIVWGNDLAFGSWEGSGALPEGSLLVEEAISREAAGDKPMGLLLMRKQLGIWRFMAIGPEGDVADGSHTERCATCHEEAPRDGVFQVGLGAASLRPAVTSVSQSRSGAEDQHDDRRAENGDGAE